MGKTIFIAFCVLSVIVNTYAFSRRDAPSAAQSNVIAESFQRNIQQFKHCLDQSFSMAANDVNENQLKPVFNILGDSILRFSKALGDLTGVSTQSPDPDLAF